MPQWITIPELILLSKKSDKTIRRLIGRLRTTDNHLSDHLKKSPTGSYLLETDYFLEKLRATSQQTSQGVEGTSHRTTQGTSQIIQAKDETIELLREELRKRDEQLKVKDEQIRKFQEAGMQTFSLLRGYQEKFLLEPINKNGEVKPLEPLGVSNPDGQVASQGTSPNASMSRHDVQANSTVADTNHKQRVAKPIFNKSQKPKSKKADQQKRKGFFSFLKGK